jgi:streptogramin lyase
LLSNNPQTLIHLDPAGAQLARTELTPSSPSKRSFLQTWWLAVGEGAVWATHPNYDIVDRIDPGTGRIVARIPVSQGRLFGVAAGGGSAWAVTDRALLRIDSTNRVVARAVLPLGSPSGFMGVSVGEGAVWATGYDRGELYRVEG